MTESFECFVVASNGTQDYYGVCDNVGELCKVVTLVAFCLSEFESRHSPLMCIKECPKHGMTSFKRESQGEGKYRERCRACGYERSAKCRKKTKKSLVDAISGGKCSGCGYDTCIEALEFHHLDPSKKEFQISSKASWSYEKLLKEAKKCVVLCANCHREVEVGIRILENARLR